MKSDLVRSALKIAALGFVGGFLILSLWVLAPPILENDNDEPGVYRISANGGHEVAYLSYQYALHLMAGEAMFGLTHYVGTPFGTFSTGDVLQGQTFRGVLTVEKIKDLDGYLITMEDRTIPVPTGSAAVLINEEIEIYSSRDEAVSSLADDGWKIDSIVFDVSTDSDSLRSVAVKFGHPYEVGRKVLRIVFILITLAFMALSTKVLIPIFRNTQSKQAGEQGAAPNP